MKLKKQNEDAQKFQNRAMKELQKLKSSPVFYKGYIKFKFPDAYIMRATFSPSETSEFVYSFLKNVFL